MYRAKANGRACYVVFDEEMHEQMLQQMDREQGLRTAIARRQLRLKYQPVIELSTGKVVGLEGFLRWRRENRDELKPGTILPIARDAGLLRDVEWWVLGEACQQLDQWRRDFPQRANLFVAVNVTLNHLTAPGSVEKLRELIERFSIPPDSLKIDLTESDLQADPSVVQECLGRIRQLGIKLVTDDFGSENSSLGGLQRFPISELKIDQALISKVDGNRDYGAVIAAIITLAHNLDLKVVAEGVETGGQLALLQALECDMAQGYYFAKPMNSREVEALLSSPDSRLHVA